MNTTTHLAMATLLSALLASVGPANASAADEAAVQLRVGVAHPTMLAETQATNFVRIALDGNETSGQRQRAPVNVALVIDRSGSMQGRKIEQAKQAAIAALQRLDEQDIVSVVLYNAGVEVLVPSTKATDRESIIKKIRNIQADGGTALFAGVSRGAAEVRKFLRDDHVNRVILLSDGHANVGPSSPSDLESLGRSLIKEGISVSTLGLGSSYNEDLMTQLASAASGNHVFVEDADYLVEVFNREFDDLMSVIANDVEIRIQLGSGVRPVRVLGTHARIEGRRVQIPLAQIYAGQQRYFIVEVEVEAKAAKRPLPLADVTVRFNNLSSDRVEQLHDKVGVHFSTSSDQVSQDTDWETMAFCSVQLITERNRTATALRDAGQVQQAKKLLQQNANELQVLALKCKDNNVTVVVPELVRNYETNTLQALNIDDDRNWARSRKVMREYQNANEQQQTYSAPNR